MEILDSRQIRTDNYTSRNEVAINIIEEYIDEPIKAAGIVDTEGNLNLTKTLFEGLGELEVLLDNTESNFKIDYYEDMELFEITFYDIRKDAYFMVPTKFKTLFLEIDNLTGILSDGNYWNNRLKEIKDGDLKELSDLILGVIISDSEKIDTEINIFDQEFGLVDKSELESAKSNIDLIKLIIKNSEKKLIEEDFKKYLKIKI